jgi:hypothetical protein
MFSRVLVITAGLLALSAAGAVALGAGGALKSGPQPGSLLTNSFASLNLNGAHKDRYHCLVCEYGLNPVALVFAREQAEAKDPALEDLLKKLDQAVGRDQEGYLKSFVVFLSPAARSAITDSKITDPEQLVQEALAREALHARLQPLADSLKHVVVATYPEQGPPGYDIAKDAAVTVVLYVKHKVTANHAFAKGKLTEQAVAQVLKSVDAVVGKARNKGAPAPAKKEAEKAQAASFRAGARLCRGPSRSSPGAPTVQAGPLHTQAKERSGRAPVPLQQVRGTQIEAPQEAGVAALMSAPGPRHCLFCACAGVVTGDGT